MRKYAANYLVTDKGIFLKNGIATARENGSIDQYIDSGGDLREVEQLSFHNGILIAGFTFKRNNSIIHNSLIDNSFGSMLLQMAGGVTHLSIHEYMEMGKQLQVQFPEMKIPVIMKEMTEILLSDGGFGKEPNPGLYLLSGADLVHLHFTPKSRLIKILNT